MLKSLGILSEQWFFRTSYGLTVFSVKDEHRLKTSKKAREMDVCPDDSDLQLVLLSEVFDCGYDCKKRNKIKAWRAGGIVNCG